MTYNEKTFLYPSDTDLNTIFIITFKRYCPAGSHSWFAVF